MAPDREDSLDWTDEIGALNDGTPIVLARRRWQRDSRREEIAPGVWLSGIAVEANALRAVVAFEVDDLAGWEITLCLGEEILEGVDISPFGLSRFRRPEERIQRYRHDQAATAAPLTTRSIRISLNSLERLGRAELRTVLARTGEGSDDALVRAALTFAVRTRRPGRRGHGPQYLAALAQRYVDLLDQTDEVGQPIDAARRIAEVDEVKVAAVRQLLWKSRRAGFLTSAPPGKQGGRLTPKAISILNQEKSPE